MMIGTFRHKVSIQQALRSYDGGGGASETWQTIADVWANICPLSGRKAVKAQKLEGTISHQVTLRWRDDVTPDMRLLYGARELEIDSVRDTGERNRRLVCMCVERVSK